MQGGRSKGRGGADQEEEEEEEEEEVMVFNATRLEAIKHIAETFQVRELNRKLAKKHTKNWEDYVRRSKRRAAVCVSLCNLEEEAAVLLTVRSGTVATHRGQVSFPGGHIEEGETAEEASIRELAEETGLSAQVLGMWHSTRAITGTMVDPILCFVEEALTIERVQELAKVSDEVESAFALHVKDLLNENNKTLDDFQERGKLPRFIVEPHPPVWGLTAFFLDGVLADYIAPVFSKTYLRTVHPSSFHLMEVANDEEEEDEE